MKPGRNNAGFTLVELLVSSAVLALIIVFATQMTSATISTVSFTSGRLEGSEGVRAVARMLRDELSTVTASKRPGRYLNLMIREDETGVALYFTVPYAQTTDLMRIGFVKHVAYVWDRQARTFTRAEYHSSREEKTVRNTAHSEDSSNMAANLARLKDITPAYKGVSPYDWISEPFWTDLLKKAQRTPLLTGVEQWTVDCMTGHVLNSDESIRNNWEKPDELPSALCVTFVLDAKQRSSASGKAGRRYTNLIPLLCADAAQ